MLAALAPGRPDAGSFWAAGHALLNDPQHLYQPAAAAVERLHMVPPPGDLDAFLSPPVVAFMAAPFALLPKPGGIVAWTVFDGLCALGGLYLLYRRLRPVHPLARPAFWLLAAWFPPLFADLDAGQRGGFALLLAAGSIFLEASRPAAAGAAAGVAAAVKLYPAAMAIGPAPGRRLPYWAGLAGAFALLTAASFAPLGLSAPGFYLTRVLIPILGAGDQDCAYDSVRSLYMRVLGGEPYLLPGGLVQLPLHYPAAALALSYLTALALAGSAVWAAWRSAWNPAYGLALGFSLGALIPNEVFPYQFLPMLPLALLLAVRSLEAARWGVLIALVVVLLGFLRQPCDLPFPNLWTLAGLGVFVIGVWENRLFRVPKGGAADGDQ